MDRRRLERVLRETAHPTGARCSPAPTVPEQRQMLRQGLHGRLAFTPYHARPERCYTFNQTEVMRNRVHCSVWS